jgi:hypothetical protein
VLRREGYRARTGHTAHYVGQGAEETKRKEVTSVPRSRRSRRPCRSRRLSWLLLSVWLLLVLVGCATTSTYHVMVPPCASPTPSGGTGTCGPLVITTDRAVYAPGNAVQLSVMSQLGHYAQPTFTVDEILTAELGCPIARAERLNGRVWEDVPLCHPSAAGGGTSKLGVHQVRLAAGKSYAETITLATGGGETDATGPVPFPTGLYQLVIHYSLVIRGTSAITIGGGDGFVATSQPFRVCPSGVCS